jgi:hypothetical protein
MKPAPVLFCAAIVCLLTMSMTAPAQAASLRTWVSSTGTNNGVCSRSSPCDTFANALAATLPSGEIDCVDAGSFGPVTIMQALTIDCGSGDTGAVGAISFPTATIGFSGIIVSAGVNDTVTLRKLSINGLGTGNAGIDFLSGKALEIENVRIMHFAHWGIVPEPNTNPASVSIVDSIVSDCGTNTTSHGNIFVTPQGGASLLNVSLKNVKMLGGANGLVVADTTGVTIHTSVEDSLASASLGDGFLATTTGGRLTMLIDHSTAVNNGQNGIEAVGSNTEVHVGYSRSFGNAGSTSISGSATLLSYGNNEIDLNGRNATPLSTTPLF